MTAPTSTLACCRRADTSSLPPETTSWVRARSRVNAALPNIWL